MTIATEPWMTTYLPVRMTMRTVAITLAEIIMTLDVWRKTALRSHGQLPYIRPETMITIDSRHLKLLIPVSPGLIRITKSKSL